MNQKNIIKFLNDFEDDIGNLYNEGKIKFPVHLGGCSNKAQEKNLIKIFKKIKKDDWILGTWRNHFLWLLSGRDPKELKRQILTNGSMHIYDDKFFTSAIVGGIAPIAVGLGLALKMRQSKNHVWCFLGDMGASTGIARESVTYATGHDLPITFVIEDNGLSVKTDTKEVWGRCRHNKIITYKYKRKFPHAGAGKFVLF